MAFQMNQLNFNTGVPVISNNMAAKFRRPEPIIIEKFGASSPLSTNTVPVLTQQNPSFSFSAVSEDNLSMAVQLAKRDIRKQKENEQAQQASSKAKARTKSPVRSRYRGAMVRETKDRRKATDRTAKKSVGARPKRRVPVQQPSHPYTPPQAILHLQRGNLPATTRSPPTRDTNPRQAKTGDEQIMDEIQRFRKEMHTCLEQIKQIEHLAKQGNISKLSKVNEDLPEAEAERRRKAWIEEHEARSARTLYSLHQQVRDIQAEMAKLQPKQITSEKKSSLLRRLAAAHRGAVRALQDLVSQITEYDLRQGLPKAHTELALLMRQLSLCCAQLEVAGDTDVPETVQHLLADMAAVNDTIDRRIHGSPERECSSREASPERKELFGQPKPKSIMVQKEVILTKAEKENARHGEREEALRKGIAALMNAAVAGSPRQRSRSPRTPRPWVPPLQLPVSPRAVDKPAARRNMAWEVPAGRGPRQSRAPKKGLLLPAKLKAQRQRIDAAIGPAYEREAHYTEPTVASQLKVVPSHERPTSPSLYCVSPPTSPRKTEKDKDNQHKRLYSRMTRGPVDSPWSTARREVARQVWSGRDPSYRSQVVQGRDLKKIVQLKNDVGQPVKWVEEVEKKIKQQLRPLLQKAQEISDDLATLRTGPIMTSRQHPGAMMHEDDVEVNSDALAEMILQDVIEETANEVSRLEATGDDGDEEDETLDITLEARRMQQAPDLENIMQRLKEMENEQEDIRRRWATIVYEDEEFTRSRRAKFYDAVGSNAPKNPPPIELSKTSGLERPSPSFYDRSVQPERADEAGPILFTKPRTNVAPQESLHLSFAGIDGPQTRAREVASERSKIGQRIELHLSRDVLHNIFTNRDRFTEHLKRVSTQSVGRFNPWTLAEEMADEIFEECLTDVAAELEDINQDIVNHIYQGEFKQIPDDIHIGVQPN